MAENDAPTALRKSSGIAPCLEQVREELKQVLEVIATASPGPLLFHCVAGKDRTGVIAALMLACR